MEHPFAEHDKVGPREVRDRQCLPLSTGAPVSGLMIFFAALAPPIALSWGLGLSHFSSEKRSHEKPAESLARGSEVGRRGPSIFRVMRPTPFA